MEELYTIILKLIQLNKEGGYWDYKDDYCENDASFLHDIICMANNLENRDAYLIYGVNNNGKIVGIQNSTRRKNQNEIINFLKGKKFFGGNRPDIELNTLTVGNNELDVLIIKNTNRTPYFLSEKFSCQNKTVREGYIYTRIGDTNTDIDKMADNDKMEYLWKKRFGCDKGVIEKLNIYLNDWENWGIYKNKYTIDEFIQGGDFGNDNYIFYKYSPEFRIEILKDTEECWDRETMRCFYCNQTAGHYVTKIYYNSTEIYSFYIAYVDEYRKFLVLPAINRIEYKDKPIYFYYMIKDEIVGKVQKIITQGTFSTVSRGISSDKFWLLLFDNNDDFDRFMDFAQIHIEEYCNTEMRNGEYAIGDEKNGAHVPMADTHRAYRIYVEYLIQEKGIDIHQFNDYFKWYKSLLCK